MVKAFSSEVEEAHSSLLEEDINKQRGTLLLNSRRKIKTINMGKKLRHR